MPQSKITTREAIILVVTVIVSHTIVSLPKTLLSTAKSAVIINMIYVGIIAILLGYVIYRLFRQFHGQDIIDISNFLGGPWLQKIVGFVFIAYFISSSAFLLRNFCEGIKIIYFPFTSVTYIILLFVVVLCITNTFTFRSNAKTISLILPIVLVSVILLFFGNAKHFSIERMLPILGDGLYQTFVVGLGNLAAFGGIGCLYFLPPYLKEPQKFKKISMLSVGVAAIYLIFCVSTLLFTFSFFVNVDEVLPLYSAARYIEFGTFFQRLESLFLLVWMLEICSYLCIANRFSMAIFQKITNLKKLKPLAFLFPLLLFAIAMIPKNYAISRYLEDSIYPYLVLGINLVLTFTILILANSKKNRKKVGVTHE
jgi:spore germination protein (amino acid permease)